MSVDISEVPSAAGVYYLLDSDGRVAYVGKAANLRRRLSDHSRTERWARVGELRWEVLASEQEAVHREADVLAALRPPWNKVVDGFFNYVSVSSGGLSLGREGDYGTFPHLGPGSILGRARDCIDGFNALRRLVKVTEPGQELLHEFLSGRHDHLLRTPLDIDQPHVRLGVEKDRALASRFFSAGPSALRRLRLRHGGRGPVSQEQFIAWIGSEVEALIRG